MNGAEVTNELTQWFSTYGVITAERILGRYAIKLAQKDLVMAIKSPSSFYRRLLEVPLKNVLNGIVLQQANDYHIYAQKLFIDYLLSGESSKTEEEQGAATRETLEEARKQLISLGDEFHTIQGKHDSLIASSQAILIRITQSFNTELVNAIKSLNATLKRGGFANVKSKILQAVVHALIYCNVTESQSENVSSLFVEKMDELLSMSLTEDIKERMAGNVSKIVEIELSLDNEINNFIDEAEEINQLANSFRNQFYESILNVIDLINSLPEYKIDPEQDAINREPLYFDKSIGVPK